MDAAVAALRRDQILVTRITPAKAKPAAAAAKAGKLGKKVRAKNLAVFTRQFSVMIDAGLPLVQCLDILGSQEEDKNFAAVILQTRTDVESGAVAGRRDAEASEDVRSAVHEHGGGRRGGRHPRHDSQAARDLHREGREAGRAGEVGHDLSGRRHRHRGAGGRRHSVEGDSDVRVAVCRPRRRVCRCRRASSSRSATTWCASSRSCSWPAVALVYAFRRYYATSGGRRVVDGRCSGRPILGNILRKIAVARFCRTLSTLISFRRADSGRPRDHGQDRRQLRHRGCGHGDAQEHRARRDHCGAAQGDRACFRRW